MAAVNGSEYAGVADGVKRFMEEYSDPRTNEWFLVKEWPLPLLAILVSYVVFCTKIGPRMMSTRAPFDLRNTLLVYNSFNVLVSVYLVYETLQCGWWGDYSLRCQPVDYSDNPKAVRMARAVWLYYMCKLVELLETVFFVLRKKQSQVSFLHLYHHLVMAFGSWLVLKFAAGGHTTFGMPINAFVHAVMYTYYLLAAAGPRYQRFLWWKRYLTRLQLVQFVAVFVHQAQIFFIDCNFPKTVAVAMSANVVCLFFLFGTFYVKTYLQGQSDKRAKSQ